MQIEVVNLTMKKIKGKELIQKYQLIQSEIEMKRKRIIWKNSQNNDNNLSTSLNSKFFKYKNNINKFVDNNKK